MTRTVLAVVFVLALVMGVSANTLNVGNDRNTPVTVYTSGGTFIGFFGQNFATGPAIKAAWDFWTVAPWFGSNNIVEYSSAQTALNSFNATINGEWVEDMSQGARDTLLNTILRGAFCMGVGYGASDGTLYCGNNPNVNHYDTAGSLLGSFTAMGFYPDGLEVANLERRVSEPASLLLMGTGLAALFGLLRKRA